MDSLNEFTLSKEDYEEPCCPLKMNINQNFTPIPIGRVLSKVDEHLSINDYASAEKTLDYWHEEAKISNDIRGELTVLNEKIGLYRKTGKKEQCLSAIDKCLALSENGEFENTVTRGTSYLNCATGYCAFDEYKRALPLYEKATGIYEKYLKSTDGRLGGLYNNTAICLMRLNKYEQSRMLFDKAIEIMSKIENAEGEIAITYCNLADLESAQNGMEKAEEKINEYLERAEELLNTKTLPRDGNYAFICEKCAGTFGYYGFFMTEKELLKRAREIYERT